MSLRVNANAEIIVRAPQQMSLRAAAQFVEQNMAWIQARLQAVQARIKTPAAWVDGTLLPLLDGQVCLRLHDDGHPPREELIQLRSAVERSGDELHVFGVCREQHSLRERVEIWYREEARRYMSERLALLGERVGLQAKSLSIRNQKTRWGSCSAKGAISMNWRLMLAPAHLVDYVLVHELCHLRHMNHSAQFWALVARHEPDYRAKRTSLRRLQPQLFI